MMTFTSGVALAAAALAVLSPLSTVVTASDLTVSTTETVYVQDLFADAAEGDIEVRGCDDDQPVELRFAYDRGEVDDLSFGVTSRDGVARSFVSSIAPWLRFSGAPTGGTVTVFATCDEPESEGSFQITSAVLALEVAGEPTMATLRAGAVPPPATVGFCRDEVTFSASYVTPVSDAPDSPVVSTPILTAPVATDDAGEASIPWGEAVTSWLGEFAPAEEGSVVLTAECVSPANRTTFTVPQSTILTPEPSPAPSSPATEVTPPATPAVQPSRAAETVQLAESGTVIGTVPVWSATALLGAGLVIIGSRRAITASRAARGSTLSARPPKRP